MAQFEVCVRYRLTRVFKIEAKSEAEAKMTAMVGFDDLEPEKEDGYHTVEWANELDEAGH